MITRELLKNEIDKIQDQYLEILYRIMKALTDAELPVTSSQDTQIFDWHTFVELTYGSLADDPIERGDQGQFETREVIE